MKERRYCGGHKGNMAFACAHVCIFVCSSTCVSVSEQHANKYLCLLLPSGGFDPVPSGSSWGCGPSSSSSDDCSAPVPSPLHPSTPPFTPLFSISSDLYYLKLFVPQNILYRDQSSLLANPSNGDGLRICTGHKQFYYVTLGYFACMNFY